MHPGSAFRELDQQTLAEIVAARGLAVIVGAHKGRALIAHAPILLDDRRMRFHLSAANALANALSRGGWALAVVSGPDAYVSPDWYGTADHVPTWNYLSCEIEGPVRVLQRAETSSLLDDLTACFEARLTPKVPWTRARMSPGRFDAMAAAVVGFEMVVQRLEGVRKLSQNKSVAERASLADHLESAAAPDAVEIARHIRAHTG